jgi:hypothetical protein
LPGWRFKYRSRNVPVLDLLIQAQGHPVAELAGTLDSGATDTVLSIKAAEALGLTLDDLRRVDDVLIADDSEVPAWVSDVPIRAQVLRPASTGEDLLPWGPIFAANVLFMEDADPLWGQEDFCASFRVILERYVVPAWFELEHWAGMSDDEPRP